MAATGVRDRVVVAIWFGVEWSEGVPSTPASGASTAAIATLGAGKRRESDLEFQEGANDIAGIVMLEIQGADDLPRLANSPFFYFILHISM